MSITKEAIQPLLNNLFDIILSLLKLRVQIQSLK